MPFITGLAAMLLQIFKTLVIDSIIKVIVNPEEVYVPQIKIGGPILES